MVEKWKASADQYNAANEVAASYQQRIFLLVQAASILQSGDVTTGQGAEAFNRVKSLLMPQANSNTSAWIRRQSSRLTLRQNRQISAAVC